ncbi:MAG: lipopolysaccharide transport periplasmic protein LptA [Gammaproteobacteria bacterium]
MKQWITRLILVACLQPALSWALSSDRDKPMMIEADQAELDDREGVSIYRGNVKVTQGSMQLTGDEISVYSKDDEIQRIIIVGKPATYQQQPDGKTQSVRARALNMVYIANPESITLTREAEVEQDGNILRSERIVYNTATDHVSAGGNNSKGRVRITLHPKKHKQNDTAQ